MALEIGTEAAQEIAGGPGSGVGQGADGLPFHEAADTLDDGQIVQRTLSLIDALEQLAQERGAFATLCALPAGFVAKEARDDGGGADRAILSSRSDGDGGGAGGHHRHQRQRIAQFPLRLHAALGGAPTRGAGLGPRN